MATKQNDRSSLTQADFYRVCKALESDPDIPTGKLTLEDVVERYSGIIPGRTLVATSIKRAMKAANLRKFVRSVRHGNPGGPMARLWIKQNRVESIIKSIGARFGMDVSSLDAEVTEEEMEKVYAERMTARHGQ